MRRCVAAGLIAVQMAGGLAAEPASQTLRQKLSDEAIRQAVRETLSETPENVRKDESPALRGDKYESFAREFSEARVPECLRPDGLKHQPTGFVARVGGQQYHVGVGGLLAAPFVAVAKLRGKCQ